VSDWATSARCRAPLNSFKQRQLKTEKTFLSCTSPHYEKPMPAIITRIAAMVIQFSCIWGIRLLLQNGKNGWLIQSWPLHIQAFLDFGSIVRVRVYPDVRKLFEKLQKLSEHKNSQAGYAVLWLAAQN
jgi:hypothetical protein